MKSAALARRLLPGAPARCWLESEADRLLPPFRRTRSSAGATRAMARRRSAARRPGQVLASITHRPRRGGVERSTGNKRVLLCRLPTATRATRLAGAAVSWRCAQHRFVVGRSRTRRPSRRSSHARAQRLLHPRSDREFHAIASIARTRRSRLTLPETRCSGGEVGDDRSAHAGPPHNCLNPWHVEAFPAWIREAPISSTERMPGRFDEAHTGCCRASSFEGAVAGTAVQVNLLARSVAATRD